jgi:hypothetical protein
MVWKMKEKEGLWFSGSQREERVEWKRGGS